jgi:hypothetical protein
MSEQPLSDDPNPTWEIQLQEMAKTFPYPPTPDIATRVRQRLNQKTHPTSWRQRLVWAAIILIILFCALLSVPQVRAAVIEFLGIGAVRIFTDGSSIPEPQSTLIPSLLVLPGETTLADAQNRVDFPIRLPTLPADLGAPNYVFVQDLEGQVVILVWTDKQNPNKVRLSLHLLGEGAIVYKHPPELLETATVHGQRAVWTEGPYLLQLKRGRGTGYEMYRLIEGHVLIWEEGDVTYRLETDLTLEEALPIAESIR